VNTVREYRMPLMMGVGALVVALLLWALLISPQNSKLAGLQTKQTQLQSQQTQLQSKLSALQGEKQNLTGSCADLEKIATQIPSVQNPTDIDAEESTFENQFNALAGSSGVTLAQFSGFAPASLTATSGTPASTTATTVPGSSPDVTAVPTTLTVTGNYGQMMAFVNGLDNFPRLFVIQRFVLTFGASAAAAASSGASGASGSSGSSNNVVASPSAPPLWVGGTPTASGSSPYSLAITGSIYYTSTPNALAACTKATATIK
jgi:Tfp pilus assembly protein PilO